MKTIWKYKVDSKVEMPKGAEVLTVQLQGEMLVMWALVDPEQERETRSFSIVYAREHARVDASCYIGTAQTSNGLEWHVFEEK